LLITLVGSEFVVTYNIEFPAVAAGEIIVSPFFMRHDTDLLVEDETV